MRLYTDVRCGSNMGFENARVEILAAYKHNFFQCYWEL